MEEDLVLQIAQLSKSLEKSIQNDDLGNIRDILTAINDLPVTMQSIKKSSLGNHISNLRKRYHQHLGATEKEVSQLSRIILEKWKKMVGNTTSSSSSSSSSSSTNLTLKLKSPAFQTNKPDPMEEFYINKGDRLKIFQLLRKTLSENSAGISSSGASISSVCQSVEVAVDKMFPQLYSSKDYGAKIRTLVYNLKRNENLRHRLISGEVQVDELINMSATELANQDVRDVRTKLGNEEVEGRRLDWIEENREKIQLDIGLDPNNVWIYERDDEDSDGDCTAD